MHTVSLDIYRAVAWCFWIAGSAVVALAATGVLGWQAAVIGLVIQITGFIPAIESIVARLQCREFDAYRQGQQAGLYEVS